VVAGVVIVVGGTLLLAARAPAQSDPAGAALPTVKIFLPSTARTVRVRVLVELRDCSARPTVTVVAAWRGHSGEARLEVSGIERVLTLSPRPAARRTDLFTFRQVHVVRGVARVRARLVTDWRHAQNGRRRCEIRLPELVGLGQSASAAQTGIVRLRTAVDVDPPRPTPQRVTATDHIWACGGGRRNSFNCGLRVTVGDADTVATSPKPPPTDPKMPAHKHANRPWHKHSKASRPDDPERPKWAGALLAVAVALGAGVAAAGTRTKRKGLNMPDSWDELARQEYAVPDEPISARASDLTKIGAPVAAFIVAILASVGGWVSDGPAAERVIAVAIVVAVAVGGLFYVFAADFRARASVTVARFSNLAKLAEREVQAKAKAQADADAQVEKAEAVSAVRIADADAAIKKADNATAEALRARESAGTEVAEAKRRAKEAEAEAVRCAAERAEIAEALRRCKEAPKPPGTTPTSPAARSSYLTLAGVSAVAGDSQATVYAVESIGDDIVRYLVLGRDNRLRWVAHNEARDVVDASTQEDPDADG
jgi:hypothetical protein